MIQEVLWLLEIVNIRWNLKVRGNCCMFSGENSTILPIDLVHMIH